ncbi:MAG TPA: hypothetical protein VKA46_35935 [Gemmataceae bacterium]|nr:hypothetical protein [Gemmataceae bacterium]
MPSLQRSKAVAILVGALVWNAFPPGVALAEDAATSVPCPVIRPHSLEELAQRSWPDLERLYRASSPGPVPVGYFRGLAIYCPEAKLAATRSKVSRLLWHGKHFSACDGTLVNQWCGFKAIRARVSCGESWLDGGPAIVMDYGGTSWVWADVRDETREVAPGLYLGAMFLRRDPQPKFKMFFALECPTARGE